MPPVAADIDDAAGVRVAAPGNAGGHEQMRCCSVRRVVALAALLALVAAAGLCLVLFPVTDGLVELLDEVRSYGVWGAMLIALLYIPAALLLVVPVVAISVGCGVLYGAGWGLLVAWFGINLGAFASFQLGRQMLRNCTILWAQREPSVVSAPIHRQREVFCANLQKRLRLYTRVSLCVLSRRPRTFIAVCRTSSLVPFAISNVLFGISDVGVLEYAVITAFACIPKELVNVMAGAALNNLAGLGDATSDLGWGFWVLLGCSGTAIVVMVVWTGRIGRVMLRVEREAEERREREAVATSIMEAMPAVAQAARTVEASVAIEVPEAGVEAIAVPQPTITPSAIDDEQVTTRSISTSEKASS